MTNDDFSITPDSEQSPTDWPTAKNPYSFEYEVDGFQFVIHINGTTPGIHLKNAAEMMYHPECVGADAWYDAWQNAVDCQHAYETYYLFAEKPNPASIPERVQNYFFDLVGSMLSDYYFDFFEPEEIKYLKWYKHKFGQLLANDLGLDTPHIGQYIASPDQRLDGYVYLIQSSTGAYKIGRSKDPNYRIKTFGVLLPFEVEYVTLIPTNNMYSLERAMHSAYASKRLNGEWFALDDRDVMTIRLLADFFGATES
jgi:predicted GIY-YIG superfamily endonuclease